VIKRIQRGFPPRLILSGLFSQFLGTGWLDIKKYLAGFHAAGNSNNQAKKNQGDLRRPGFYIDIAHLNQHGLLLTQLLHMASQANFAVIVRDAQERFN
jgi:hypothetical protein